MHPDKTTDDLMSEIAESDILVVVEGKKDIAALKKHGVTNIYELGKTSVELAAEEIAQSTGDDNECLILTDFDVEGRKLAKKLNACLPQMGINVRKDLRREFNRITRLVCIEGL